ncbi:ABC transporter permease [Methylobacterium sp. Leaf399]|uniref:MFS transporter n=1 Tax=Methylobacterium sp. Leaf399 TaxID=1736364 RepID=UPI0006F754D0|nr:MFS transporter [Methylobacterium sp. Leaf399]KQT10051.1 ABC transporter permease [Methylobacterium sp. Leaf399]
MTVPRSHHRRPAPPRDVPRAELRPRPLTRRATPADTAAETSPDMTAIARASSRGLDGFTFFVANLQTGFGPFLAVYFTQAQWTQSDIGFALTVGSLVSLLGQVPGGAFVDAVRSRRFSAGVSVVAIAASAFALAMWPNFLIVLLAMAVHSAASCILTPAIAAISIGLVGHARAGERLGRNASFSALGNAVAAAVMGACGYYISNDAVFYFTAALMIPTLICLSHIRPPAAGRAEAGAREAAEGGTGEAPGGGIRALLTNRALMCFAACMTLFFLANAAMLPLVGSMLTLRASETATALIAACIVVPQVVLALTGPAVGRAAERWGRRPLLLIGFAALPIRGLLFAYTESPELLVAIQVLDGVSAAVFGVMVPLVVSDATRYTGRFNMALGAVGTAMGIGAALSTSLAGVMADKLGSQSAFLGLAIVGFAGFALLALIMPETRRDPLA